MPRLSIATASLGCFAICGAASGKSVPTYNITVVAPPPPATVIVANRANDLGHFIGVTSGPRGVAYVFWSPDSGIIELNPPAGQIVELGGINDSDEVAVATSDGAYTWSSVTGWTALPSPPGFANAYPTSINDRGEIVGYGFNGSGGDDDRSRRALKWNKDGELVALHPNAEYVPSSINDDQDVLLTRYWTKNGALLNEAVLMPHQGEEIKLGELPDNGRGVHSTAAGLSDKGFVALDSPDSDIGIDVACFWSAGKGVRSLALGPSTAIGMSGQGTMAGIVPSGGGHGFYSFAWSPRWAGGAIDLADHLVPGSPQFDKLQVHGISGNGTIAGEGWQGSVVNAVVLTPVQE